MRHELATGSSDKIVVKDYDSMRPLVGLTVTGGSTALNAQQVDELIVMLQFYRARLEFVPKEKK